MEEGFKLEQVAIRLVPEAAVWDAEPIRSPERAVEVIGKYFRPFFRWLLADYPTICNEVLIE